MKKLAFIALILSLTLGACQSKYPELKDGVYAEFITNKGTFVAKLTEEKTPLTVANFVDLAEGTNEMVDSIYKGKKFYNGLTFHRIIKDFMIQGGDPLGTGSGSPGYKFPDETTPDLKMDKKGVLAMANSGPNTNGSQFFITLKDTPWLNGRHTVFGEIVLGQEIVDSIGLVETKKPGDKPVDPVIINEVNIIKKGAVTVPSFKDEMVAIELKQKELEDKRKKVAKTTSKNLKNILEKAETLPSGIKIVFTEKGTGEKPEEGSTINMNYAGYLTDGTLFDSNIETIAKKYEMYDERRAEAGGYKPVPSKYGKDAPLIPGFREGLLQMGVGDKATIYIPSHLAYGERGAGGVIPPNSDLIFDLELVNIVK
ncbi:MAG: peptidylprolyl isomerase [Flavobacteriales bacterium]